MCLGMMAVPNPLDVADDANPDFIQTLELVDDDRQLLLLAENQYFFQQRGERGHHAMNVQSQNGLCLFLEFVALYGFCLLADEEIKIRPSLEGLRHQSGLSCASPTYQDCKLCGLICRIIKLQQFVDFLFSVVEFHFYKFVNYKKLNLLQR